MAAVVASSWVFIWSAAWLRWEGPLLLSLEGRVIQELASFGCYATISGIVIVFGIGAFSGDDAGC